MTGSLVYRKALWCLLAALSFSLVSCGSSLEFYRDVDADLSSGKYADAIRQVRGNARSYEDKSTVLYNLDLGLLYHYAGAFDSSIVHLSAAEREIEDLYTKSISLAAASLLLNDNVLHYEGEDFEKVLLNVFLALNYFGLNQPDEALVEVRKVDLKLREYAKQYEGKNRYQDDAFIRYIAGVLYESGDEVNDAFISYRKAYDSYQLYEKAYGTKAPPWLLDDLVRTATLLSFDDEREEYVGLGGTPYTPSGRPQGTVLVVTYSGKGPVKEEAHPTVSVADNDGTIHTFQVALPKFIPRLTGGRTYTVSVARTADSLQVLHQPAALAEDVTAIAARALDDRLTLVYLKSGGRALLKFLAAEKAKKEIKKDDNVLTNVLGSVAVDAVVGATERADLRGWRTLPAEIQLARFNVNPGEYTVQVTSSDGVLRDRGRTVTVAPGRANIVMINDLR